MHAELVEEVFFGEYRTSSFFGDLLVFKSCAGAQGYVLDLVSSTGYRVLGRKKEREQLHGESAVG